MYHETDVNGASNNVLPIRAHQLKCETFGMEESIDIPGLNCPKYNYLLVDTGREILHCYLIVQLDILSGSFLMLITLDFLGEYLESIVHDILVLQLKKGYL